MKMTAIERYFCTRPAQIIAEQEPSETIERAASFVLKQESEYKNITELILMIKRKIYEDRGRKASDFDLTNINEARAFMEVNSMTLPDITREQIRVLYGQFIEGMAIHEGDLKTATNSQLWQILMTTITATQLVRKTSS